MFWGLVAPKNYNSKTRNSSDFKMHKGFIKKPKNYFENGR